MIDFVSTCHALQAGCIALVDAFQFRNEYMPTSTITTMLDQVLNYVIINFVVFQNVLLLSQHHHHHHHHQTTASVIMI
jgi:large-conductance mechanosensitive channel